MGLLEWMLLAIALVVLAVAVKFFTSNKSATVPLEGRINKSAGALERLASAAPAPVSQSEPATETALIGPDGKTLLSVAFLDEATFNRSQTVSMPSLDIDRLSPILQLAPDIATAAKVAGSNLYHVVIGGDMIAAKGIPDALRPMTRGANGQFSEMALLYNTDALSALVSSGLIINIASMALAQKHLADISAKLEALQTSVSAISWFQNSERRASIEGTLRYFQEISGPMAKGEQPWTFQHQIEAHYATLLATEQHLLLDIENRAKRTIPALKDAGQWGSEVFRTAIGDEAAHLEDIMRQWSLCIRARLQAWCLQALVPGNAEIKRVRLQAISQSVEKMNGPEGLLSVAIKAITTKIDEINSKVETADALSKHRKAFRENLANRAGALWQGLDETEQMVLRAGEVSADATGPLNLAVRVTNGHIVEARAIAQESNPLSALSPAKEAQQLGVRRG